MDPNHRNRRGKGFSLVELLVVMAVLATILLIAIPAFTRVVVVTRRVKCSKTLHNIGIAYDVRLLETHTNEGLTGIFANGWARQFAPYFGFHRDAFWCTATGKSDGMGYDAKGESPDGAESLSDVKIRIFKGGSKLYDVETFNAYPYWLEGSHIDFGRAPGIWKVNAGIYEGLDRYNMPKYTPGSDPKEYWFVIEDQRVADDTGTYGTAGGDTDFNDFDLHVVEKGIFVVLTGYHKYASYTFALVDMDANVFKESGGMIGPIELEGTKRLSYGMNTQVHETARLGRNSSDTIIVIDYKAEVVSTGRWIGMSEGWDVLNAPRHMGKLNSLYADGHVQTHDPDEIDPTLGKGETFWDPLTPIQ